MVEQPVLSLVIPTWDEGDSLLALLQSLQPLRTQGVEILVADGEGSDLARFAGLPLADHWLATKPGRAFQMQAAATIARGNTLAFVHVDTRVDLALFQLLLTAPDGWGFFPVQLLPETSAMRLVAWSMNLRSRLSGIGTGDQLLWVSRSRFWQVGGYPAQKLMEDIALCRKLKRTGAPVFLPGRVGSSARRWQQRGWLRTIVLMWTLRARYWLGADPDHLARIYYPEHKQLNE
ncbi:TIGR04283 family arsenosugar biosynthesis glycosyltransferase [Simiduia agarivorans]|uniref:Glycosyl transferase family protein n=1 Tax=Simiduia agarivorans (strain DSM 21679 / JCM 13881 / BCRC 17597 / SA1) TaxID=1117647 RepID=K4KH27_SIMAS|nr:TIGR04283 family arsenosugar biosynthesis glycosyltransferase [Simiduia agarivorans]AFU97510.1 glycosyl transferase family protein [Simiduia agarivorans SA1 = DSM 21679]